LTAQYWYGGTNLGHGCGGSQVRVLPAAIGARSLQRHWQPDTQADLDSPMIEVPVLPGVACTCCPRGSLSAPFFTMMMSSEYD
jgi:hypothetical protein